MREISPLVFPASVYFITWNRDTCQRSQFPMPPKKPVHAFSFSIIHFVARPARQFFGSIEIAPRRDLMNVTGSYRRGDETLGKENSLVETLGTPFDHINTINLDGKHDSYYRHSTIPSLPSVPDKFTFFLFSVFVLYGLSTARKTRDITITGSKIPVVEY